MIRIKFIVIALSKIGAMGVPLSQAHSNPDKVAVCFKFTDSKLKKT